MLIVPLVVSGSGQAAAQEPSPPLQAAAPDATQNPLATLNEELKQVLAAAGLAFTEEQERAVALMMEERRRASEALFGGLMDFRDGPTRGQEEDRLRSAIEWMRTEFLRRLAIYLTPEQAAAWTPVSAERRWRHADTREAAAPPTQTQFVRINNNAFTAEYLNFNSGGGSTDVIQRGGVGAWHGNAQFLLKDDALNARNAFACNKPSYQERRFSVDVERSGHSRSADLEPRVNQTETEDVDTINATLPTASSRSGSRGRTTTGSPASTNTLSGWPTRTRSAASTSATPRVSRDQGIGGFTLPERGLGLERRRVERSSCRQFSALSSAQISRGDASTSAATQRRRFRSATRLRIDVLDAFNGGGAQNRTETTTRTTRSATCTRGSARR